MLGMTYLVTPLSVGGTKYNDAYVGLCVCLRAYLQNYTYNLCQFYAYNLWL